MSERKVIGPYTAYTIAVKYGYTGTEEEWNAEQNTLRNESVAAAKEASDSKSAAAASATAAAASATNAAASAKIATDTVASIPDDYNTLSDTVNKIADEIVTKSDDATDNTRIAYSTASNEYEVPTMEEFNALSGEIVEHSSDPETSWAVGYIGLAGQIATTLKTRIYTEISIYAKSGSTVAVADGYQFRVAKYSAPAIASGNFVENVPTSGFRTDAYTLDTDCYIGITLARTDNATMTADEAENVTFDIITSRIDDVDADIKVPKALYADVVEYKDEETVSTLENTGFDFSIVSYNVGYWNMGNSSIPGFPCKIYNAKLSNFKRFLMDVDADVLAVQENAQYLDQAQTIASTTHLYSPKYNYTYGVGGPAIMAKLKAKNGGNGQYSNGRYYRWITLALSDDITLLVFDTHPVSGQSDDAVANRLTQYTEAFALVAELTAQYGCTHWVMCGDFNSSSDTDLSNLTSLASANNATLGNGGYLGWVATCNGNAVDNIIVSNNIIINDFRVHEGWFGSLYSDHCPVSAKLTLTATALS